jgi:CDP-diacylglycerol--glycerol-3-phosphate 3-phosphatidyltransferase
MVHDQKPTTLVERVVYVKTWSMTLRRLIEYLPDWITPNRVTIFRASLTLPIFWTLSTGRFRTALAVFALATALDAVDGAIAHIKNMGTPSGAFLDPLADKLILCGALVAVWTALPAWILIVAGVTLLYAAVITLLRIYRMICARCLSGSALAQTIAAKPAGKVKTIFDTLAAMLIIAGLGLGSGTILNAGGAVIVIGSFLAAIIYFSPAGQAAVRVSK